MQLKTDSTMGDIFIANNVIAEISGGCRFKMLRRCRHGG